MLVLVFAAAVMPAKPCQAGMQELADTELSVVHAAGFSSFTLDNSDPAFSLAKMSFNTVIASTYTTIDSLKMGYYDNGTALGWDQDWSGVSLGSSNTNPLVFKGLYIEAKFTNIDNSGTRQLEYVKIGTTDLTGPVSAVFNSFSGEIGSTVYDRVNLNPGAPATTTTTTITAANTGFYLSLDRTSGFRFHWNAASISSVTTP